MSDRIEVREHLLRALEADLVGPSDPEVPDELLPLAPSRWYLTDFLAPTGARDPKNPTAVDELAIGSDEDEEETGGNEPEAKQKNFFPASMGLLPDGPVTDVVTATVSFAERRRTLSAAIGFKRQERQEERRTKEDWWIGMRSGNPRFLL